MLTNQEIQRYSRQLILSKVGVKGQECLKNAKVLVVGAGGLGSSVLLYLAGAGLGTLGIVDYDKVEFSNLQRQIIHDESKLGMHKADSAKDAVLKLNSCINVNVYKEFINSQNILEIIRNYDVIVDATDNVPTRYLLNDAAVLHGKILVSGSALQWEGQLTIYNYKGSPCYRCLFPDPPPPETIKNCADGGVLGVIPGLIGSLQALEVVKIVIGQDPTYAGKMLLMDGLLGSFKTVKLRSKQKNCLVCGESPAILKILDDYPSFCGSPVVDKLPMIKLIPDQDRITVFQYQDLKKDKHLLVDVRESMQYDICCLSNSKSIPLRILEQDNHDADILNAIKNSIPIYIICRLGNDSQRAVKYLKSRYDSIKVKDIIGGLEEYALQIDPTFPSFLLSFPGRIKLYNRLLWGYCLLIGIFIVCVVIMSLPIPPNTYFILIMILITLSGIASSLLSGIFTLIILKAASYPPIYTSAITSGQGLGGLLPAVSQLIILILNPDSIVASDHDETAQLYFIISVVVSILGLLSYITILRLKDAQSQEEIQYFLEDESRSQDSISEPLIISRSEIFNKIYWHVISVFLTLCITLCLFPSITSSILPNHDQTNLFITVHFLVYNLFDWIGKSIPGIFSFRISNQTLHLLSISRLLFIPLFIHCNINILDNDHHRIYTPTIWFGDVSFFLILVVFALSNGFISTVLLMNAPLLLQYTPWEGSIEAQGYVGDCMVFGLGCGLTIGALSSFGLRSFLCECNPF